MTYIAANRGICLVRADGKVPVRLTPRWRGLGTPAWSPRGRYIAFKRTFADDAGHTTSKIAVADARGRVHWTFGTWDKNGSPLWSPDGRHIAYRGLNADGSNGFDVTRPDGSHDRRVLTCPRTDCEARPSWSADGRRVAFDELGPGGYPEIVSTLADGSDSRLLVGDNAGQPAYSPTGSRLAYIAPTNGFQSSWSVFVANADGTHPRALAGHDASWPTWSPDGRFLAFVEGALGTPGNKIEVVRADGTGAPVVVARDVPRPGYFRSFMGWSPDGKLIAYLRGSALVVARADGKGERLVASRVGNVGYTSDGVGVEAWRPAVDLPAAQRNTCPRR